MCWMAKEVFDGSLTYSKSGDVQVAGYMMYYVLSGGHIPCESQYPYFNDPAGVMKKVQNNQFSLRYLPPDCIAYSHLLQQMISPDPHLRPDIGTCILKFIDPSKYETMLAENLLHSILRGEVHDKDDLKVNNSPHRDDCDFSGESAKNSGMSRNDMEENSSQGAGGDCEGDDDDVGDASGGDADFDDKSSSHDYDDNNGSVGDREDDCDSDYDGKDDTESSDGEDDDYDHGGDNDKEDDDDDDNDDDWTPHLLMVWNRARNTLNLLMENMSLL